MQNTIDVAFYAVPGALHLAISVRQLFAGRSWRSLPQRVAGAVAWFSAPFAGLTLSLLLAANKTQFAPIFAFAIIFTAYLGAAHACTYERRRLATVRRVKTTVAWVLGDDGFVTPVGCFDADGSRIPLARGQLVEIIARHSWLFGHPLDAKISNTSPEPP